MSFTGFSFYSTSFSSEFVIFGKTLLMIFVNGFRDGYSALND